MDYIIRNKGGLYIKLNENGTPITCGENQRELFEYSKATNICNSLPKTLKKFKFQIEAVPDIKQKVESEITTNTYKPSENVIRWVNELGQCGDIIDKASERDKELDQELSGVDLKMQDVLHEIELSDRCDMYKAWMIVNNIRDLRRQRREIKDEKLVLSGIKSQGITYLNRKSVQKCIDGLGNRKYKIRIVDE